MMKTKNTYAIVGALVMVAFVLLSGFKADNGNESALEASKQSMIDDWKWARDYTLAYIEAMPEDGINIRPVDSVRSFAEQMLHITSADVGFTAAAFGVAPPIENVQGLEKNESYKNKEALREVVETGYNFVIETLEGADANTMGDDVTLFGRFEMTREVAIQKAFIHQNHHRGQTAVYIRMAGGTPPPMNLF